MHDMKGKRTSKAHSSTWTQLSDLPTHHKSTAILSLKIVFLLMLQYRIIHFTLSFHHSFPCLPIPMPHCISRALCVGCNCPNKRASVWSHMLHHISSGDFSCPPSALLANVVHQQKREGEWGDFSTEYPTQKRAHKDSPSPTHPLTHTDKHTLSLWLRMAPH